MSAPKNGSTIDYRTISGSELAAAEEVLSAFRAEVAHRIPDSETLGPLQIALDLLKAFMCGDLVAGPGVRDAGLTKALNERNALLDALRHMQFCRPCAEDGWDDCDGGRAALAAIAKATGGES